MSKKKVSTFNDLLLKLDKDPKFRQAYRTQAPYYELLLAVIKRRKELGLTQKELAKLAGTHQSNISRIESGELDVRLSTLIQLAEAMETKVCVWLVPFYDGDDDQSYYKLLDIEQEMYQESPQSREVSAIINWGDRVKV